MFIDLVQGYIILFTFCLICVIGILIFTRWKKAKLIAVLKRGWGEDNPGFGNFSLISIYHKSSPDGKRQVLDEKTSSDLNLHDVYSKVDRCRSKIGQQYLYSMLHSPVSDEKVLKVRGNLIELFMNNPGLRLKVQMEICELNKHLTYTIPNLIFDWTLKPIKYRLLVLLLSSMPILLVLFGLYYSSSSYLLIPVSFLTNLIVHYKNKSKLKFFMTPFAQIILLSKYARKIGDSNETLGRFYPDGADQKFRKLRLTQFLSTTDNHEQNEFSSFISLLLEYIKITFLLELNLFDKSMKIASSSREEIHDLYKYVGLIDSCISIASYRAGLDSYCVPQFNQSPRVKTEDIVHPLINDCVPNSINTDGKNLLITGSNMSGKTTFIRTLALNAILAQSIYTVCAESYEACFLNVSTSIAVSDSLLLGKSYYLKELESVYSFIERSDEGEIVNFFVMDELFKGTNTVERIAAGQAVLEYLARGNNIVLVSTHDLELSTLLTGKYDLYHFTEEVNDQGFYFDHKIKKGVLKKRNAIKLLEYFGYPEEIIRSAKAYIQSAEDSE